MHSVISPKSSKGGSHNGGRPRWILCVVSLFLWAAGAGWGSHAVERDKSLVLTVSTAVSLDFNQLMGVVIGGTRVTLEPLWLFLYMLLV